MRHWKILVIIGVVGLLGLVWWLMRTTDAPAPPKPQISSVWGHVESWPLEGALDVDLAQDPSGPAIRHKGVEHPITPEFPDLKIESWSIKDGVWTASAAYGTHPATLRWTFAPGNPQAVFELHIPSLPRELLSAPFAGTLTLPKGDIRYLDSTLRPTPFVGQPAAIENHTPGWIEWRGPFDVVISQWWADRTEVSEVGDQQRITFLVWHPDVHPNVENCPEAAGNVEITFRMMLTMGTSPPVVLGRYRQGASAAIIPIFSHPQGDGAPTSAEDFVKRARTLSFGHSNPGDPRHGNGGLAAEHGGTLLAPAKWSQDKGLIGLAAELQNIGVEIAFVGTDQSSIIRPEGECASMASIAWLAGGMLFSGAYTNSFATPTPFGPAIVAPALLNPLQIDTRDALTTQALSRPYTERLVRDRGVLIFETPLTATRNPLVPAAAQALLSPERNGEWTISPELESTFAGLELLREDQPFRVMSVSTWLEELGDHRTHEIWWTSDKTLLLRPHTAGLTLIAHDVTLSAEGLQVRFQDETQQWSVVGAEQTTINIPNQLLKTVNWKLAP